MSAVERAEIERRLHAEAEAQAQAEAEDAQEDATGAHVGGGIMEFVGRQIGGALGDVATVAGGAISQGGDHRITRAEKRIEEIYKAELAQKEQEWAELSRSQEFEADAIGYQYMATAGFDPQGCFRVMDVLNSLPGTQFDGEHPATPARIEALRQMMSQQPAATLAAEGRTKLAVNPQPLTYDISRDNASLRINSRHGASGGWPF